VHAVGTHTFAAANASSGPDGVSPPGPASSSSFPPPTSPRDDPTEPAGGEKRLYHFQVKGAEAKKSIDRSMIKCMCHEVAAAASERARAIFGKPRVAERSDPTPRESSAARSHFLEDDFCVFSHTVMRDILDAKHAKHTFWGSTHWCGSDESVSKAVAQMTLADVGALLVMDRVSLDRDKNDVISEDELRAAPESGAIKGIVSERDYLRAVAQGRVTPSTTVKEIMVDFERDPDRLVSVTPECSVLAAMEIMTEHRIRHIPCISPASADGERGAKMEGMVTIGDVVKALISEEREEVALCHDYIHGAYS
jgi:CBS domain-containing protein